MREKLLHNFSGKFVVAFILMVLFVSGVCCAGIKDSVALAADVESEVSANTEGYYVKELTGADFNEHKSAGTYPKLTIEDGSDSQDWLFAGWYQTKNEDGTCADAYDKQTTSVDETKAVYAKFVSSGILTVKCQVTPDTNAKSGKTNMRLISTTDSLDYSGIGFDVVFNQKTVNCKTTTLYKRITATDDGMESGYSPNAFDADSEYFFSVRLINIKNENFQKEFYIQPYWKTLDGTKVYGNNRYARVEDSYEKNLNLPVRLYSDEMVTDGSVSLKYDATKFELYDWDGAAKTNGTVFDTVTLENSVDTTTNVGTIVLTGNSATAVVADGIFANIRLQLKKGQLIESNTTFEVTNLGFENGENDVTINVLDVLYRNYSLEYEGNPDTSWYDEFKDEETFVISTAADLYGLAKIVNDTTDSVYKSEQFSGKKIILGADITVNKGEASLTGWVPETSETDYAPYEWEPIGKTANSNTLFKGTLDGNNHTIRGLYMKDDEVATSSTTKFLGLFGDTYQGCVIQNLQLKNSYFECVTGDKNGQALMGSIAGQFRGNANNVYSDAVVVSAKPVVGGLFGRTNPGAATSSHSIKECWFDGQVSVAVATEAEHQRVGGLIGTEQQGSLTMENCLNTGTVTFRYANSVDDNVNLGVGGLTGSFAFAAKATIKYSNCMNAGKVVIQQGDSVDTAAEVTDQNGVGSIVGYENQKVTSLSLANVYATSESAGSFGYRKDGTEVAAESISVADINGHYGYANLNSLGIYDSETNPEGKWVIRETANDASKGCPAIKSLCDKYIDVDWYYETANYTAGNNEFVISNAEELHGFSDISKNYTFANDIVSLDADIEMNTGNASSWYAGKTEPHRAFTPISSFAGTFDGNEKTISGLYINDSSSAGVGLFKISVAGSTIKNFTLTNSYYDVSMTQSGCVVGVTQGSVQDVYVTDTVTLKSTATKTGGIIGELNGSGTSRVSNCWFEGTIESSNAQSGGIIGLVSQGTKNIENCLVTGKVINTLPNNNASGSAQAGFIGGIIGRALGSATVNLNVRYCLAAGEVEALTEAAVGAVLGRSGKNAKLTVDFEHVYYVNEPTGAEFSSVRTIAGCGNGSASSDFCTMLGQPQQIDADNLKGVKAYKYTELDLANLNENTEAVWVAMRDGVPKLNLFADSDVESFGNEERLAKGWYYNAFTYAGTSSSEVITQKTVEFTITTAEDMYGFADLVNTEKNTFNGLTVKLGEDIIFNNATEGTEASAWANNETTRPANSWTPIGSTTSGEEFQGTFDGDNHSVSGLYISSDEENIGLFRRTKDATICNLKLTNSFIESTIASDKLSHMSSVVARGDGILENIYSDAILHGNGSIGGIFGVVNDGKNTTELKVTSCWYDGVIKATYQGSGRAYVGGVVGYPVHNETVIDTCLYTGKINFYVTYTGTNTDSQGYGPQIGGICSGDNGASGTSYANVLNSVSAGEIHATMLAGTNNPSFSYIGSIIGQARHASTTVTNSYALTTMSDTKVSTGKTTTRTAAYYGSDSKQSTEGTDKSFMGAPDAMYGYGAQLWTDLSFTDEHRIAADNAALAEGETPITEAGAIWAAIAGDIPVPKALVENALEMTIGKPITDLSEFTGDGSEDNPYLITTIEELAGFSQISKSNSFANQYVALGNNIVINSGEDASNWVGDKAEPTVPWNISIGAHDSGDSEGTRFAGIFDGKGHTISGICFENASKGTTDYVGLFATTDTGSAIQNLRLTNSYFEQVGSGYVGSIVGECCGTISNVYSNAIVKTVADNAGGIAARVDATESTISDCWFDGTINSNRRNIGGMIGFLIQGEWTLKNCLFTGTINQTYTGEYFADAGGFCGKIDYQGENPVLVVESCISAGTINTSNGGYGAGAVVGRVAGDFINTVTEKDEDGNTIITDIGEARASELQMSNVFATRESGAQSVGYSKAVTKTDTSGNSDTATPQVSGTVVWVSNTDRLIGYCKEDTTTDYTGANLDFTSSEPTWVIREKGIPVPATFTDMATPVDIATLDAAIGLDKWTTFDNNASLVNAVHYGVGKYVLTFGSSANDSKSTYEDYIDYLTKSETEGGLGFTLYASNTLDELYDTIYTKEMGDWVLNVLHTDNTGVTTITIRTGIQELLSPNLLSENVTQEGENNITLSMLQLTGTEETLLEQHLYYYGNSFVFQLPNKHFIVNDGGNKNDFAGLMEYLKQLAGTDTVCIDAWIVTHQHGDHFGVVKGFYDNPTAAEGVTVEAFYINEPNNRAFDFICKKDGAYKKVNSEASSQYRGVQSATTSDGKTTPVYSYQTGERYYFNGITMDVIQSQEQIPVASYAKVNTSADDGTDFNTVSSVLLFTTKDNEKILIGGDANYVNMDYIMHAYGDDPVTLNAIDVFVAWHHGKNTSYNISTVDNTFTNYLTDNGTHTFDAVLFPCEKFYGIDEWTELGNAFPAAGEANTYLRSLCSESYHYGAGTKVITFGNE